MKTKTFLFLISLLAFPLFAEEGRGHAAPKARTIDELFAARCEHKIPQYTCDECRYELGLVKLDATLMSTNGLVMIETAQKRIAQAFLPMNAEIALNEAALTHVSSLSSGRVRTVCVEQGAQVKQGQVLFELESQELGHALGAYRKNKALAALALRQVEREKALVEKRLSPEAELVDAQMKYDEYRIELESAAYALSVMGLDAAEVGALTADNPVGKIGCLPVRAPQSGTVIEKHVAPGETVEPGKELLMIAELSTVWVWMDLYEHDLAALTAEAKKRPPRVQITTPAFHDAVFEGVIDLFGATMNEQTRTVKVRACLQNKEAMLRPGMFCAARVVFETPEKVLTVPPGALLADEGKRFVFRLVREGFALRTDVETGRVFTDSVEITAGLAEGEKIVGRGAFLLKSDVLREKMGAGCAD